MSILKHIPECYKAGIRKRLMPHLNHNSIQVHSKKPIHHTDKVALLVEVRPQLNLDYIVKEHLAHLPGWHSAIVTSEANLYLKEHCDHLILVPENWANTYRRYQNFMCAPLIWEQLCSLRYDIALCYQTDTRILRNGIEEFTQWDWVGAPWPQEALKASGGVGGNGGLSIRNISSMLAVAKQFKWAGEGEDMFFVKHMQKLGAKLAPQTVCAQFSCECYFKLGTVGCHAIQRYMNPTQIHQILSQYLTNPANPNETRNHH